MDFLNKSFAQVSELFRSMTPGARLTAGLLLAVVVASVAYMFRQNASGADAYLFGGEPLSNGQLTAVEAAIAKAGLSGWEREGNCIKVPAGQQAAYLAAVVDNGALPPNCNTILQKAADGGNVWDSSEANRARMKIAKEQTLSEIIRAMNWVENAVVLYDEHESRGLRRVDPVKQVSASVSVKPISGETLTAARAKNIRELVAHAVNMQVSDVGVTDLGNGGGGYGGEGEMNADVFPEGSLMHTKVAFELQKRDSIMKALRDFPGASVEVNADFDSTKEESVSSIKPDPKAVALREQVSNESSEQVAGENSGVPGTKSQGPNRTAPTPATAKNQSKTMSSTGDTQNVVGATTTTTHKSDFNLKEVWATVALPSSYVENLWKARNPTASTPPKPEDLTPIRTQAVTNVEEIVEPLLTLQVNKGENQYKHVRVVVVDSLPAPAIVPPSFANTATSWLGRYWNTLGMLGVAMFSLLVLRSMVNGKPGDASGPAAASQGLTLHGDEPAAGTRNEGGSASAPGTAESTPDRPRLRLKKGNSLKDDLVAIVREDPDAAADILRSWIGKAS